MIYTFCSDMIYDNLHENCELWDGTINYYTEGEHGGYNILQNINWVTQPQKTKWIKEWVLITY